MCLQSCKIRRPVFSQTRLSFVNDSIKDKLIHEVIKSNEEVLI